MVNIIGGGGSLWVAFLGFFSTPINRLGLGVANQFDFELSLQLHCDQFVNDYQGFNYKEMIRANVCMSAEMDWEQTDE